MPALTPSPDLADLPPWKRRHLPPEPIDGTVQGDTYWAVYLAIEEGRRVTPKLRRAARLWERREMHPSTHDLDCDRGARAALGLPPKTPYIVVSTYFFERESARALASIVGLPKQRIAPVRVFCLD